MKRTITILSIIVPPAVLILLAAFPGLDNSYAIPLSHFYIVTLSTFAAVVVAIFTGITLTAESPARHRLLVTSFAAIGAIFFVHGITTPGAITFAVNPGIRWAAWLTLLVGSMLFAGAATDRPGHVMPGSLLRRINWGTAIFCAGFALVVLLAPHWLDAVDAGASPWHGHAIYGLTSAIWAFATVQLWHTWRRTGGRVDGVMVLVSFWQLVGTSSMHLFPLWNLSWWLYHVLLLAGAITALATLTVEYEQLRVFRLTRYYATLSLIVTAALALLASNLYSRATERDLARELSQQALYVGRNLSAGLMSDLPEMASADDLRQVANDPNASLATSLELRLIGLELAAVNIYARDGEPLYSSEPDLISQFGPMDTLFLAAIEGNGGAELEAPEQLNAGPALFLRTQVPIHAGPVSTDELLGVLETIQGLPGLDAAVIRARLVGLAIAAFSMGALFLALLLVVNRSDRLITTRNNELRQAYADLQAAEAMRDDLTDMIVHDLRSPLTAISLNIDLLDKSAAQPEQVDYRKRFIVGAKKSVGQMLRMIEDLLDVARMEAGRLRANPTTFSLCDLLAERVELFTPQFVSSSKKIRLVCPAELGMVSADIPLIGRVVDNLIGNAIKFMAEGGQLIVTAEHDGVYARVKIVDDGAGIPPEELGRIFEKFVQVTDEFGEPVRHGTGLGLAFCKLVIETHGGRIWVESVVGLGSTFFFTLPYASNPNGIR